ncbi:hypothetical protein E1293_06540 [Actinomadura darangshiensis]|uniref:Uncharacterized protein n=1 Tax=Actinomadura darangshiensis TaxID=705336 RepID=A0A4R5BVP1_9ACTN|nr:hypothetical protein E1293_06540 [Actinomadura darangshiensis]
MPEGCAGGGLAAGSRAGAAGAAYDGDRGGRDRGGADAASGGLVVPDGGGEDHEADRAGVPRGVTRFRPRDGHRNPLSSGGEGKPGQRSALFTGFWANRP